MAKREIKKAITKVNISSQMRTLVGFIDYFN